MKKIKSLHIEARRWFQKSYGNTYHSVVVHVTGEERKADKYGSSKMFVTTETLRCPFAYGYGDHFIQTAEKLLIDAGYDLKFSKQYKGWYTTTHLTTYHLREALHGTYSVADVARKKDL